MSKMQQEKIKLFKKIKALKKQVAALDNNPNDDINQKILSLENAIYEHQQTTNEKLAFLENVLARNDLEHERHENSIAKLNNRINELVKQNEAVLTTKRVNELKTSSNCVDTTMQEKPTIWHQLCIGNSSNSNNKQPVTNYSFSLPVGSKPSTATTEVKFAGFSDTWNLK